MLEKEKLTVIAEIMATFHGRDDAQGKFIKTNHAVPHS
jgi:hypothetical protein